MTFFAVGLVLSALANAAAVLLLVAERLGGRRLSAAAPGGLPLAFVGAAVAAWAFTGEVDSVVAATLALVALAAAAFVVLPGFFPSAVLLVSTSLALVGFGVVWGTWFITTMPVSTLTRALMLGGLPLAMVGLPAAAVETFENWEPLCRRRWRRGLRLLRLAPTGHRRVSIHVPAHAEPPEVVMATLGALAALDHPNFEVLVIDNNTSDPALWRPVEAHCRALGERFRFFHVEGLTGAKAGALNFALRHTDPAAELVAVVDADYQVEPSFLTATVGYFDDPDTGFVQTPHAYRDWEASRYLTMCRWEYAHFFATQLVSRNERVAALTVGTMCVIRREALEGAGGWAEWCLTEDSELAVRIHALGYTSVYLTEVYGRGLIPDTFAGYKTQRFRWTYGPVQELRRHFRLFLPRRWRHPSRLSAAQRLHHATHGVGRANMGLALAAAPWGVATAASMVAHGEVVPLPAPLWLAATAVVFGRLVLHWLSYRVLLGARLHDILGAMVASGALAHTVAVAALFGVVGRQVPWRRTDKFRRPRRGAAALGSVRTEALLAVTCIAFVVAGFAALPRSGVATMLLVGVAFQGLLYSAAVVMTVLSERDLSRVHHPVGEVIGLPAAEAEGTPALGLEVRRRRA